MISGKKRFWAIRQQYGSDPFRESEPLNDKKGVRRELWQGGQFSFQSYSFISRCLARESRDLRHKVVALREALCLAWPPPGSD